MTQKRNARSFPKFSKTVLFVIFVLSLITLPSTQGFTQNNAPWPRLPDGRVVLEIKGHHVAFFPDLIPFEVQFLSAPRGGRNELSLREAINEPGRARASFQAAQSVWIFFSNSTQQPGRFLNRFERESLPIPGGFFFRIGLYASVSASPCTLPPGEYGDLEIRLCERFSSLIAAPPALNEYGFIVDRPAFNRSYIYYIFPGAERLSSRNEPIYIVCGPLGVCGNDSVDYPRGYFIRPGVRILYQFLLSRHPPSTWRDVESRFREIANYVLIEGGSVP